MNLYNNLKEQPYRIFIPIGIIGLLMGLSRFFVPYSTESIFWHKEIMITLFLLPTATGFIMTAAPRFLGAWWTNKAELFLLIFNFLLLLICAWFQAEIAFSILKLLSVSQLFIFFMTRWQKGSAVNPYWPPFIIIGLLTGFLGAGIQLWQQNLPIENQVLILGNKLYYEGMFWILLSGIGIKFFPMITSSTSPALRANPRSFLSKDQYQSSFVWYCTAILFTLSFFIEGLGFTISGLWLRCILVLFMAYEGWSILATPLRKGITTFFVNLFMWILVIGHIIFPLYPEGIAHFYHIVFIAGFLSLTLIVATRVLLSHEHVGLEAEQHSIWILSVYSLQLIALLARLLAYFLPIHFLLLLKAASVISALGVILLVLVIAQKLFSNKLSATE